MTTKKTKQFKFNRLTDSKKFSGNNTKKQISEKLRRMKHGTARQRGYDAKWEKYRHRFLHHNPKCYACGGKAQVVDHFLPARLDTEKLFWKADNYLPLCKSCHDTVTGKFDRLNPPDTKGKLQWLSLKREALGVRVRVKIVPIRERER